MILVFDSEKSQKEILKEFKNIRKTKKTELTSLFGEGSHKIHLEIAPEPFEIFWDNISYNNHERSKRRILSWFISLVILAVLTVIIYFILHGKTALLIHSLSDEHIEE